MSWIQTYTGKQFWPLDPRIDDIDLLDIAHALSNQCRFSGHCELFYSVAEHSAMVCDALPVYLKKWGLLHDAAEAYLVDLPRPLKINMPLYQEAENILLMAIAERFKLTWPIPEQVLVVDRRMLASEAEQIMRAKPAPWPGLEGIKPFDHYYYSPHFWAPTQAREEFKRRCKAWGVV